MGPHPHRAQGDPITEFLLLSDSSDEDWRELIEVLEGRGHTALALRRSEDLPAHVRPGATVVVGFGEAGAAVRRFATDHPGVASGLATIAAPPVEGAEVPGGEPRIAVICEDDDVIAYDDQKRAAYQWRAQPGSVPGGHHAHRKHPALVATLLINWLAPEST